MRLSRFYITFLACSISRITCSKMMRGPLGWLCQRRANLPKRLRSILPWRLQARRGLASLLDSKPFPEPGPNSHGFILKRSKKVPELQLTAFHLEHEKTGAEYLHVARDDQNNVFSIGFKTNPPDDTGVPHILEHTTLCGSKKWVWNIPGHLTYTEA